MLLTRAGIFCFSVRGEVPGARLLLKYKHCSAPVVLVTEGWTEEERLPVLALVPHKSAIEHAPFLCKEFASMVEKGQWMVLSYLVAKGLLVLRLSLPRVKVKRDRRP